jgi:uncharacterized protein
MDDKSLKIINDLKKHLQFHLGEIIKDVILFGSRSGNNYSEFSDYDVLIVVNDDFSGKLENKIFDLCYDIDLKYDIMLDIHVLSINELNSLRGKQPVFLNAIKTGIYA